MEKTEKKKKKKLKKRGKLMEKRGILLKVLPVFTKKSKKLKICMKNGEKLYFNDIYPLAGRRADGRRREG